LPVQVSIVIVNWNTRDHLIQCLRSIRENGPQCEVVVVDNGSNDSSSEIVKSDFPEVKLVLQKENQGYSRANMAGFRISSGKYVVFLNSDTILPAGTLDCLVGLMEEQPRIAACAPRIVQWDGKTQPFAFGGDPRLGYLLARACARLGIHAPLHDWETAGILDVDWVSGACLFARRSAFEQVGGFDERIYLYFEDNDLCLRLRKAGWRVVYNPLATITHIGGASFSNAESRKECYYQSLRYFYSKHYSPFSCLALRILLPLYQQYTG
jgi:N-acetylglucosaminyl-diphospho-decaprenol L-rhamnosyltransferase